MRDHGIEARERAGSFLDRHRYSGGECSRSEGGEVAIAKRVVRRALDQHENAEHGGRHEKLRLKSGGKVHGKKTEDRPDRKRRAEGGSTEDLRKDEGEKEYEGHMKAEHAGSSERGEEEGRARGGSEPKHKGRGGEGGKGHIGAVNIAIGNPEKEQAAKQQGLQAGMQIGMQKGMLAAKAGAGGPPPGAGGPPPGAAMPPRPPMAGPPPGAGMPPGGAPPPGAGGPPPGMMPPRKDGGFVEVRGHKRRKAGGAA